MVVIPLSSHQSPQWRICRRVVPRRHTRLVVVLLDGRRVCRSLMLVSSDKLAMDKIAMTTSSEKQRVEK